MIFWLDFKGWGRIMEDGECCSCKRSDNISHRFIKKYFPKSDLSNIVKFTIMRKDKRIGVTSEVPVDKKFLLKLGRDMRDALGVIILL